MESVGVSTDRTAGSARTCANTRCDTALASVSCAPATAEDRKNALRPIKDPLLLCAVAAVSTAEAAAPGGSANSAWLLSKNRLPARDHREPLVALVVLDAVGVQRHRDGAVSTGREQR